MSKYQHQIAAAFREASRSFSNATGSVLVYLIVVILIFGVLGVTMVSLFTTATTSSATRNDARRAYNMAESGVRYAFSELRNSSFSPNAFNALNTTTYNVIDAGSFTINTFCPRFRSSIDQYLSANDDLMLTVPTGKLPVGFNIPNDLWIINFDYTDPNIQGTRSQITGYTKINNTALKLTVSDKFNVSKGESVCLLFKPSHDHTVSENGDLYIEHIAKDFFLRFYGAININGFDYSYDRLIDELENKRVRLENLTAFRFRDPPYEFPLNITETGSFIVFSPRNYMMIPTGVSGSASYGNDYEYRTGLYDYAPGIDKQEDISDDELTSNFNINPTSQGFMGVNTAADRLNIGEGVVPGDQAEFGAGWYDANKSIGGRNDFCLSGRCLFGLGIRVFFILKFVDGLQGDGLTFTLMNSEGRELLAPNNLLNDVNSVGGDFQLSELMGYAGDSRTNDDGFLDPSDPRGIQPPKLAIEFDTRTNFDEAFESEPEPKDFCIELLNLKPDTRNDPLSNNRDAVQYVFWGDSSFGATNVPCRISNPSASVDTYDDNRHGTIDPPINDRTIAITSMDELDSSVAVDDPNDWLNGSTSRGPWAIRIEIEREKFPNAGGNFDYTIQTWIRQCATDAGSINCTDASIIGIRNPFQNTRIKYNFTPAGVTRLRQQVELTERDHNAFERFFFGFTGAAGLEALDAEISQFQLSFIRLGDSEVTSDPNWTP